MILTSRRPLVNMIEAREHGCTYALLLRKHCPQSRWTVTRRARRWSCPTTTSLLMWRGIWVFILTLHARPWEVVPFPEKWNTSRKYFPSRVFVISFYSFSHCLCLLPCSCFPSSKCNSLLQGMDQGICKQMPYSERVWRKLSKGKWESHSHGEVLSWMITSMPLAYTLLILPPFL